MAAGLTLIPSYTSDNIFPAYQDRLLIKSLGVQAGVVETEDYKVAAGSGLQVNVKAGKAFVEQTKAIEESNNTFYNGLYNVLNPTEQNPYNSVEIPTTNPQIAQIILRVYDTTELGISGSSYARLEWLNGTANAGATKAHVEAGEALSFGASALPQSSMRIAYIIVPKNATVLSEFEIIDSRRFVKKPKLQVLGPVTGPKTVKEGEMLVSETSGAVISLPAEPNNAEVGIFCGSSATSVTVSAKGGGTISGDFINAASSIVLTTRQHVILQSNGINWIITSGEPAEGRAVRGTVTGTALSYMSWALISSAAVIEASSGDFSSVEKSETSVYKINWKNAKSNAKYSVNATVVGVANRVATVLSPQETGFFKIIIMNAATAEQAAQQFSVQVASLS